MNINAQNIESHIFDYHEGVLSAAEKNSVLDYIHQHPEYEAVFASFAMTYAHVDPIVKEYNLENVLLEITKPKTFWRGYYAISVVILSSLLVWWFYPNSPQKELETTIKLNTKSILKQEADIDAKPKESNKSNEIIHYNVLQLPVSYTENDLPNTNDQSNDSISTTVEAVKSDLTVKEDSIQKQNAELETSKTHISQKDSNLMTKVKVFEKVKKQESPKRKFKFKLATSDDIAPINSDF